MLDCKHNVLQKPILLKMEKEIIFLAVTINRIVPGSSVRLGHKTSPDTSIVWFTHEETDILLWNVVTRSQDWRWREKTHASSPSTSGKTHEVTAHFCIAFFVLGCNRQAQESNDFTNNKLMINSLSWYYQHYDCDIFSDLQALSGSQIKMGKIKKEKKGK